VSCSYRGSQGLATLHIVVKYYLYANIIIPINSADVLLC